jgi:hypothetical protein
VLFEQIYIYSCVLAKKSEAESQQLREIPEFDIGDDEHDMFVDRDNRGRW